MSEQERAGLTLIRPLELKGMSLVPSSPAISFIEISTCPIDGGAFRVFAEHSSEKKSAKVRIAVCESCGYVGYQDKPTEKWIESFYSGDVWDSVVEKGESKEKKVKGRSNASLKLLSKISLAENARILDVGCGYGESLLFLKEKGFSALYGIEHSPHRARVARELKIAEVMDGAFGNESSMNVLRKQAPYDAIICHHVLEHTYDPKNIVVAFASLQEKGGHLVLSVPDVEGEVTMTTLLFLPHLHAFSLRSLHELFIAAGYGIIDVMRDGRVLTVLAQKGESSKIQQPEVKNNFEFMVQKTRGALGMDKAYRYAPRRLWWDIKVDVGGQTCYFSNPLVDKLNWNFYQLWLRIRYTFFSPKMERGVLPPFTHGMRTFLVEDCPPEKLSSRAPITLHSRGDLTLLYK